MSWRRPARSRPAHRGGGKWRFRAAGGFPFNRGQAQTFLSPQQVAALNQMRRQQQAQQTLNNVLNAKAPPGPATPAAPKPGK